MAVCMLILITLNWYKNGEKSSRHSQHHHKNTGIIVRVRTSCIKHPCLGSCLYWGLSPRGQEHLTSKFTGFSSVLYFSSELGKSVQIKKEFQEDWKSVRGHCRYVRSLFHCTVRRIKKSCLQNLLSGWVVNMGGKSTEKGITCQLRSKIALVVNFTRATSHPTKIIFEKI